MQMPTRSEVGRAIPSRELEQWQQWEAEQPRAAGHLLHLLALVSLLVILPVLGWVLYIPVHVDALVLWIELTFLYAGQRIFERRAILHPTEFTVMVALYICLSSVARVVDYLRATTALGQPIQGFELAYRLGGAVLLLAIGYAGGHWMAQNARLRFDHWRAWR